ncbi:uncharacterized protein LOC121251182 [Juglans microcarpa x Juglans regia]|uniref:uncharacterized protein LOC121251182 n=1 Tax=Juglans microcarpa x Juglans regia TaxID=2249226 RepID=UPI001B7E8F67|nr:uncharacterized protein LOC121251182 [Juglans microcarpa x Juglans regia]
MFDCRQRFAGKPLSPVSPTYQIRRSHDSEGDIEFDFWGACQNGDHDSFSGRFSGTDVEFQSQASLVEEGFGDSSPALWERNTSGSTDYESSPLLPHDHRSSNLSPTSRKKAIAEGRRQLMEMVRHMSESCYELSLKDIVDEKHISAVQKGTVVEKSSAFHPETEPQMKKQKKKKKGINKARQVSRIRSMDSENFLLKMFFPTSLALKKKSKAGECSKVSPTPSFVETKHHIDKEWWIKRFFLVGDSKRSRGNIMSGSTSSSNSSTSRHDDASFIPGCWCFFHTKKNKAKRQKGCLLECN